MYPLNVVSDDIRDKLIARGIPAEEIAYIHDAKTEQQKADLFDNTAQRTVRQMRRRFFGRLYSDHDAILDVSLGGTVQDDGKDGAQMMC